jgi:hypothetical protein
MLTRFEILLDQPLPLNEKRRKEWNYPMAVYLDAPTQFFEIHVSTKQPIIPYM